MIIHLHPYDKWWYRWRRLLDRKLHELEPNQGIQVKKTHDHTKEKIIEVIEKSGLNKEDFTVFRRGREGTAHFWQIYRR